MLLRLRCGFLGRNKSFKFKEKRENGKGIWYPFAVLKHALLSSLLLLTETRAPKRLLRNILSSANWDVPLKLPSIIYDTH